MTPLISQLNIKVPKLKQEIRLLPLFCIKKLNDENKKIWTEESLNIDYPTLDIFFNFQSKRVDILLKFAHNPNRVKTCFAGITD